MKTTYLIRKCKYEFYHSSIFTNKHISQTNVENIKSCSQQKSTSYEFNPDEFNTYFFSIGS